MHKKNFVFLVINTLSLLAMLFMTNPHHLPLLLLLVPGINSLCIAYVVADYVTGRIRLSVGIRRLIMTVILSSFFVSSILLSLGQFTVRDFTLLFSFTLLGVFYVVRMWGTDN